jgi:iron(III) transport system substrate-binding protein
VAGAPEGADVDRLPATAVVGPRNRPGGGAWSALAVFARLAAAIALLPALMECRAPARDEVVAYTSVDQVFAEPVFRSCEARQGIAVRAVFDTEETKSTGVLNRLLAEADNPRADVFWSGDPIRSFVLVARGLVEPYVSPEATTVPPAFRSSDGTWTGVAARARVLLVDRRQVPAAERPDSIEDLADPRWHGRTAIANPLFGTTTMHAAALFTTWGDERAKAFFDGLQANEVRVASSNGEVRRLVASGEVAFGLTDSDDAFGDITEGQAVDVVYPDQAGMGTLVMPTTVVLMRRGPNGSAGRRLVDCLLSADTELAMARAAAHMPLRGGLEVPAHVVPVASIRAMEVDYAAVAETMQRIQPWLRGWTGL